MRTDYRESNNQMEFNMHEHLMMPQQLTKEQLGATDEIARKALEVIENRYGKDSPNHLTYHNERHARSVGLGALKVSVALGLSPAEQRTSELAGYPHDVVQLKGRGLDEQESAQWLEEEITKHELLPRAMAKLGSYAILGTEPIFGEVNGQIMLVGQKATEIDYPTKSAEMIAKSVASADLGVLYSPEGPYLSHQLYHEIQGTDTNQDPPLDNLLRFQRGQVYLAENYAYPLRQAEEIFGTHRTEVTNYAHQVLGQIESGEIENWTQLIEQDKQFMRDNS